MTLLEKLQAAELPVIGASEAGSIIMGPMTPEQEQQYMDIVLEHFLPVLYTEIVAHRAAILQFREQYNWAVSRYQEIIDLPNPSTVNLATLTAMANAIKDEARIGKRLLEALKQVLL